MEMWRKDVQAAKTGRIKSPVHINFLVRAVCSICWWTLQTLVHIASFTTYPTPHILHHISHTTYHALKYSSSCPHCIWHSFSSAYSPFLYIAGTEVRIFQRRPATVVPWNNEAIYENPESVHGCMKSCILDEVKNYLITTWLYTVTNNTKSLWYNWYN